MVITVFWAPSWTVPVISISALFLTVVFLLCCLCLQRKRTEKLNLATVHHRSHSLNKLMIFRNHDPVRRQDSESDLLETEEASRRFRDSRLEINDLDEDVASCCSGDSRFTFYSTYPAMGRSESVGSDTATFKSLRTSLKAIPVSRANSANAFVV